MEDLVIWQAADGRGLKWWVHFIFMRSIEGAMSQVLRSFDFMPILKIVPKPRMWTINYFTSVHINFFCQMFLQLNNTIIH